MKKLFLTIVLTLFTVSALYSQNGYNEIKQLYDQDELLQAAEKIPAAVKKEYDNFDLMVLAGDVYYELERYEDALQMYLNADKIDRNEVHVLKRLGNTNSMLGNHSKAFEYFQDALDDVEGEEAQSEYKLALAEAYIRADSIGKAELIVTQVRDYDDDNPRVYIILGDLYFAQRVYALAKDNYEEALELDPENIEARRKLAISYYWLANREYDQDLANELFTRSLKEWNEITKKSPKDAIAWFEQGKILYFGGRYPDAAKSLYEYVQLRPQGDLGRWYLAQSLYEVGACDSAAPHLQIVASEIDSVKSKARLMLAQCYMQNEEYAKSAAAYEKINAEGELELIDQRRYGQASLFSGDTTKAIEIWTKAVVDYPQDEGNCKLSYLLGQLLTSKKVTSEAVDIFKLWLKNESCEPEGNQLSQVNYFIGYNYVFAAQADTSKNFSDSASVYLNRAIELDSTNYFAWLYLGDIYASQNKSEDAINVFNFINENADTSNQQIITQSFIKLSGLHLDNKDWTSLLKVTKKWLEILGDNEYGLLYRAVGFQGSGDLENACKSYKKVLGINPNNSTAKQNYAALKCGQSQE